MGTILVYISVIKYPV